MTTGVACPVCGWDSTTVLDSRARTGGQFRRRECNQCSARFTTVEVDSATYKKHCEEMEFWLTLKNMLAKGLHDIIATEPKP